MIIILMRHGQTKLNKLKLIQGRSNYPLNKVGKNEVKEYAITLKKEIPKIDYFFSSPLKRAIQSCKIVKKIYNNKDNIIIKDELIERAFGALEMAPTAELPYFIEDNSISGFENNLMLKDRMLKFLQSITDEYPKDAIIFMSAHSHSIKGILVNLFKEYKYTDKIKNGSYIILNYDKINQTYKLSKEDN